VNFHRAVLAIKGNIPLVFSQKDNLASTYAGFSFFTAGATFL
jgi:hypothetical protein